MEITLAIVTLSSGWPGTAPNSWLAGKQNRKGNGEEEEEKKNEEEEKAEKKAEERGVCKLF